MAHFRHGASVAAAGALTVQRGLVLLMRQKEIANEKSEKYWIFEAAFLMPWAIVSRKTKARKKPRRVAVWLMCRRPAIDIAKGLKSSGKRAADVVCRIDSLLMPMRLYMTTTTNSRKTPRILSRNKTRRDACEESGLSQGA